MIVVIFPMKTTARIKVAEVKSLRLLFLFAIFDYSKLWLWFIIFPP